MEKKIETLDVKQANELLISDAIKAERQRVKNLSALKCKNAAVNAIIDVAITEGGEVADVTKYIDAVKNIKVEEPKNASLEEIKAVIRDNLKSGAENVGGSLPATPAEDKRMSDAKAIAEIANSLKGVKKNG